MKAEKGPAKLPMPEKKGYKYNTIALEPDFMIQMIGFGDAIIEETFSGGSEVITGFSKDKTPDLSYLNVAHWFSWVPDAVKPEVQLLASRAMERAKYSISRRDLKVRFIAEFQELLAEKVEKLPGLKAKFARLTPEEMGYDVERKGLDDSDTTLTLRAAAEWGGGADPDAHGDVSPGAGGPSAVGVPDPGVNPEGAGNADRSS